MKSILMTGVTGFVGSSLAARFLSEGCRVVALSRDDHDGSRTRKVVQQSAKGFGLNLPASKLQKLSVLNIDYQNLTALQDHPLFKTVDEAWHIAAEMTYNPKKLDSAIRQNLNATYALYSLLENASHCKRFYYMSTAYTAGMASGQVREELHLSPSLVNVYQTSKWSAEMSLAHAHQRGRLPVTIFRPSIVVGHSKNGWSGNTYFGFYTFVNSILFASHLGSSSLKLNVLPDAQVNLIPIDLVCDYACKLSLRPVASTDLEIFHAAATGSFDCRKVCDITGRMLDVKIHIAQPHLFIDKVIDSRFQKNAPFARKSWKFEMTQLEKALDRDFQPFQMTDDVLERLVRTFANNQDKSFRPSSSRQKVQMATIRLQMQREKIEQKIRTLPRQLLAKMG